MCFRKTTINWTVSDHDIEVYKVFRRVNKVLTPSYYTGAFVDDFVYSDVHDCEYTCEDFGMYIKSAKSYKGFHSFRNYADAIGLMDWLNEWPIDGETYEIIPCVIKAGVRYYEGLDANMSEVFLSEKITVKY